MPSLLVRDINEETKRQLAIRAAQDGISQQAEVRKILEQALEPSESWLTSVMDQAQAVGGIDIPLQTRHAPRVTGISFDFAS